MNPKFDKDNLPSQYQSMVMTQPYYKGDGAHSVKELQKLLNQYQEYSHQQALVKQGLIREVVRQDEILDRVELKNTFSLKDWLKNKKNK